MKTYENGLRLVLLQNDKNVIAANFLVGVGSNYEEKDEEGLSHFIEHLLFKSSEKFSTDEIMKKLTFFGAEYNAYTSKNLTRFVFMCLKENFEECFEIYSDMIISPKFLDEEIDRERNVVIEEMKKHEDNPVSVMFQTVINNYFNGTTFAHDVLGNEKIISEVSRDKLIKFKNKHYTSDNMVISVVGNIDFEKLDAIVTKFLADKFNYKKEPRKLCFEEIEINCQKKYAVVQRKNSQVNVCVHIKGVPNTSSMEYVSDLYSYILGGTSSSRLYKTVREEQGLVYSITSFSESEPRNGEISIVFGTRPKNLNKALTFVKNIVMQLASNVTEEELEAAKNFAKSTLEYSNETNSEMAETCGNFLYYKNRLVSLDERKEKYSKVTLTEIKTFAEQIAKETTFNVVAVGDNIKVDNLKVF